MAGKVDLSQYEPLISGQRKGIQLALLSSLLINIRRISMLLSAMFVTHNRFHQIQLFIALNFVAFMNAFVVQPFEEKRENFINVINELSALLVAYIFLLQQDARFDPD